MNVEKRYILRRIADEYCLVPFGSAVWDNKDIITISEAAALLYEHIQEVRGISELAELLVEKYGIDMESAVNDTREFTQYLKDNDIIRFS